VRATLTSARDDGNPAAVASLIPDIITLFGTADAAEGSRRSPNGARQHSPAADLQGDERSHPSLPEIDRSTSVT
jgi:hypothetical protein